MTNREYVRKTLIASLLTLLFFVVVIVIAGRFENRAKILHDEVYTTTTSTTVQGPTIGGHRVPDLHCQEDEAIVLMNTDVPECVNVEQLATNS